MALTNRDLQIISDLIDTKLNPVRKEIQKGLDRLEIIIHSVAKDGETANFENNDKAPEKQPAVNRLSLEITNLLHRFCIPPHIMGYNYLRDAVLLTLEEPEIIHSITTQLYPKVAQKNASIAPRVERAIRHAIEVAWDRADPDVINEFFGNVMNERRGKPTNAEFIATIYEKLKTN